MKTFDIYADMQVEDITKPARLDPSKVAAALAEIAELTVTRPENPETGALWGLYFALYFADPSVLLSAPRSVQDAFARVQRIHLNLQH